MSDTVSEARRELDYLLNILLKDTADAAVGNLIAAVRAEERANAQQFREGAAAENARSRLVEERLVELEDDVWGLRQSGAYKSSEAASGR